jgi:hypothetical protein
MTLNAPRVSALIGATALATLVAAAPAGAMYENGAHHRVSRIHSHHYGYRYGPAGVVGTAGAAAGEAAGGLFHAGATAWDALDCVTFGYWCRR